MNKIADSFLKGLLFLVLPCLIFGCLIFSESGTGTVTRTRYKDGKLYTGDEVVVCGEDALALLKQYDPVGYAVYEEIVRLQKEEGKTGFLFWLNCDMKDYHVGSAVHESVHELTDYSGGNMFSYYLPSGKYYPVQIIDLFNRCEIAPYLGEEEKDIYFQIYMTGKTGNQDLRILLDEVNAYTFSVINALHLAPATGGNMDREGLATMMWYLELYLHHARFREKGDFRKIESNKEYLSLIKILWENAEKVLADSSQYEKYGMNERYKLKRVYAGENLDELHAAFEKSTIKIDFDDTIYNKYNLDEEIKPVVIPFEDKMKLDEFLNDL